MSLTFRQQNVGRVWQKQFCLVKYVRLHLYGVFIYRNTRYTAKWICLPHYNLLLLTVVKRKSRRKRQHNSTQSIFPKWLGVRVNKIPCDYILKIQDVENPKSTGWPWLKQKNFAILTVVSITSSEATARYISFNQLNPFTI